MKIALSILYPPIIFLVLSYFNTSIDDVLVLKGFPFVVSSVITFLIFLSYIRKNSMILYFAKKFLKKEISHKEQEYIHSSTLFWVAVSLVNVMIHGVVFFGSDDSLWVFYSSIGWYFIFIVAFVFQMIHRAIYFEGLKSV